MEDLILCWDKPLTSQQAAKYHMTAGFIPVELYRELLRTISESMQGETHCPFCGHDLVEKYSCQTCNVDHMGKECFHDGGHKKGCIVTKADIVKGK